MLDTFETDRLISSESVHRRIGPVALLAMAALIGGLALIVWASVRGPSSAFGVAEPDAPSEPAGDDATASVADVAIDSSGSTRTADSKPALVPSDRCEVLVGRTPLLTVRTPNPWISCVVVADFQQMIVWNNGPEPMTVDWPGDELDIAVNESVQTTPAGVSFPVGPTKVDSSPYLIPTIWRLPRESSPTIGLEVADDRFGPVVVGMTVERAAAELGRQLEAGPVESWPDECAFLADDPYSPIFVLDIPLSDASTIRGIIDLKPGGASVGAVGGCQTGR